MSATPLPRLNRNPRQAPLTKEQLKLLERLALMRASHPLLAKGLTDVLLALVLRTTVGRLERSGINLRPPPKPLGKVRPTAWTPYERELHGRLIAVKDGWPSFGKRLSHKRIGWVLSKTKSSINGRTRRKGWSENRGPRKRRR